MKSSEYKLVTASAAVRQCLKKAGMDVDEAEVIYPGARVDLFGAATSQTTSTTSHRMEQQSGPLRVCFCRIADGKQRDHTLLEAILTQEAGVAYPCNACWWHISKGLR